MSSPSLVGGIALRTYDLPSSIFFAVAVVLFSLRASAAARPHTEALGLSEYMQATFALGFLSLAHIISTLVRGVLVNATLPLSASESGEGDAEQTAQPSIVSSDSLWKPSWASSPPPPTAGPTDDPRRRFWFRRWSGCMLALFLAGMIMASVAMSHLYAADATAASRRDQALRFASAAIGLVLVLSVGGMLLWARRNVPSVNQRAVRFLLTAIALLLLPPIYRLAVMRRTTPDIAAVDAAALNTLASKATFYVLHVLPEWIVVAMMAAFNVREICGIGFKGDERWRDETPEERAKRERKAREREMKRAAGKNASFELKESSSNTSTETNTLA
ncbi:hypothetical protein B0H17DRAFT_1059137 [Mycena rosella]|uniref:Proteophosphoglycan ppg4 n=1 Tax=Mycena rosella TaxID=1033263 RepID=A0AAD7GGC3_MYCRO|nr:hypothetical protein B0H17DRAFT_1059137 [Mycena rosella]